jgi:LysR family transcriptional regulator of gallate degradation
MIPTPEGVSVATSCRRIMSELSKVFDDVRSISGGATGLVRVGALAYSRTALLPDAIRQTLARYPDIRLRTVEGPIEALLTALHGGDIDLVLCAYPNRAFLDGIDVEPIADDRLGFFVSRDHPLAGQADLNLRDLENYPFILPPAGSITRRLLEQFFLDGGGKLPEGRAETSSYSLVRNLLMGSQLIAFRSCREFEGRQPNESIVLLTMERSMPSRKICVLQRRGAHPTAAVSEFLGVVRSLPTRSSDELPADAAEGGSAP